MPSDMDRFLSLAVKAWMDEPDAIPKLVSTNARLHAEKAAIWSERERLTAENERLTRENETAWQTLERERASWQAEADALAGQVAALREALLDMLESYDLCVNGEIAFDEWTRNVLRGAFVGTPERARAVLASAGGEGQG